MARKHQVAAVQGLPLIQLAGGQIGWSVGELVLTRANRFSQFQQAVAAPCEPSPEMVAARMVAFDGVSPHALRLLQDQNAKLHPQGDQVSIEWIEAEPIRLERRLLSPMTLMAWPRATGDELIGLKGFVGAFKKWLPRLGNPWKVVTAWEELREDQLCWLQEQVPGTLLGHLSGMAPMSALPRATWARRERCEPLRFEIEEPVSDLSATVVLVQAALDAEGEHYSNAVIQMAEDVFTKAINLTLDGHIKRAWAMELGKLEGRLRRAHPAVSMIIAWAAHLCEAGTLEASNPAASTVKRYAKRAMAPLGMRLKELPTEIESWDRDRLAEIYGDLMRQTTASSRAEMSAALGSFQAFMEEWLDIAPVPCPKGDWTPGKPTVRSNVLWDHEIELALKMCDQCVDRRLGRMAMCCFLIAQENPLRIQDLLRLRICNIHAFTDALGGALEVEVVRDAGRGRLKTETSQRRLWMRNPESIKTIQAWTAFRVGEAAPIDALLFGERGNDHRVYRRAALHTFLNAVLKQVTGDPAVRFHHMRHSRISQELDALLCSVGTTDINRLEVLAADAGHSTPQTTLSVYSHIYERSLRMWLDLALMKQLSLTGRQAQDWLGEKANTLAQAGRRRQLSLAELVLERLSVNTSKLHIESVSHGFQWGQVTPPLTSQPRSVEITVYVVADAVTRLAAGAPVQQVAELLDVMPQSVQMLADQLTAWLQQLASELYPRKFLSVKTNNLPALLEQVGADTKRMFGDRLPKLRDYLSEQVPQELLMQAIQSWEMCGQGDHIAMGDRAPVRGVLSLLSATRMRPDAVCIACPKLPDATQSAIALHSVTNMFMEEFRLAPIVESRDVRSGRSDIYLLLTTQPDKPQTSSAASANGVLKAWLVACQAFLIFQRVQKEDNQ